MGTSPLPQTKDANMATPLHTQPRTRVAWMERMNEQGGFMPYLLVMPAMLVFLAIAVYPVFDSIRISFLDDPLVLNPSFVGLRNYVQILSDPIFLAAMGTTLFFTVVSVALETLFGLGIALLINKEF